MWSNPKARVAVDCEEIDPGYVREAIVVGSAWGPKQGSQGSNTAESCIAGGAMSIASLSLQRRASAAEQ